MKWHQQSKPYRYYLLLIYGLAALTATYYFTRAPQFGPEWTLLSVTSVFVATINIRLPRISSVISMGDVFVVLSLLHFGPGPAIVNYWIIVTAATFTDVLRRHGKQIKGKIFLHRSFFNLSWCALCVLAMDLSYRWIQSLNLNSRLELVASLAAIAVSGFAVNKVT